MQPDLDLKTLVQELHIVSQFRFAIMDAREQPICACPQALCSFCQTLQQHPKVRDICRESDAAAFEQVRKTGRSFIYQCPFGLWEAVSPITHFGVLTGYLMMGQTVDGTPDSMEQLKQVTLPYLPSEAVFDRVVASVPKKTPEQIRSCMTILDICASYISLHHRLNTRTNDLALKIKQYLDANFRHAVSLDQLSELFYCSKSTLNQYFKDAYNVTIHAYLLELRLRESRTLLEESSLPIREISELCGFSNQNYFNKVFRRCYGTAPSACRKRRPD